MGIAAVVAQTHPFPLRWWARPPHLLGTKGWLGPANTQLHLYGGPVRGWDEPGFALAQDVLAAAPCSAREGFWGISRAYPSHGTGERWQFKQPSQPCELALCRAVAVQLAAGNLSDLWQWARVIPAVLWYLAQVPAWVKWWVDTCQRPGCARQQACDELQSSSSSACQVHL